MNTSPSPASPLSRRPLLGTLPTIGGRQFRRRRWREFFLSLLAVVVFAILFVVSRPRVSPLPIADLEKNGVHGIYNLKAANGELLMYNFRAIEPGKIYRSSGFPRNHRGKLGGKMGLHPAAFFNRRAFDFLREKNIRVIVSLNSPQESYAEKGYLDEYARQTGHAIRLVFFTLPQDLAYSRSSPDGRRFGLKAATDVIEFLKEQAPAEGAVLIHDGAGKDGVGVVAAAYELWRNAGHADRETLWRQVMERYLVSDVLIKRDKEARKFAGKPYVCKNGERAFVCPELLESLRFDLERIAQMN